MNFSSPPHVPVIERASVHYGAGTLGCPTRHSHRFIDVQNVGSDRRATVAGPIEGAEGGPVDIPEPGTCKVDIDQLSENCLVALKPNGTYLGAKKTIDWLSALIGLLLFLPIGLAIAAAIRVDSPGPALFRQVRVGYRGEAFTLYKFRTMAVATRPGQADLDAAMTEDDDKRVTRLGRFLRRSRLDETPQLFNVLRGEMSWIGPRPEALTLSQWYEHQLPFYRHRLAVLPGISGWAQVNQGHVTKVEQVQEKLHYDLYYVQNCSLRLDLLIILRTIRTVLTGFGAR